MFFPKPLFSTGKWQHTIRLLILVLLPNEVLSQNNKGLFEGGIGDGYDTATYAQPVSNAIFSGGPGDGYASYTIAQAVTNAIFAGGPGDGYESSSFRQATHNPIFAGGFGDGYDQETGTVRASPYDLYILGLGISGADADELNDYDSDGQANIVEFALGSLANSASSLPELRAARTTNGEFTLTYLRRKGGDLLQNHLYSADDIFYFGESSLDLITWENFTLDVPNPTGLPEPPANYEYGTFRLIDPNEDDKGFLRIFIDWLE